MPLILSSYILQYQRPRLLVWGAEPIKLLVTRLSQVVRSKENLKNGLKGNYGRLIDFLSQISKLSYFNLLDLADVLMHH